MLYVRFTKLLPHIQFIPCFHWFDSSIRPTENNCEVGSPNHCNALWVNSWKWNNFYLPMFYHFHFSFSQMLAWSQFNQTQGRLRALDVPPLQDFDNPPCHSDSTFAEKRFRSRFTEPFWPPWIWSALFLHCHMWYIKTTGQVANAKIRKGLWALSALGGYGCVTGRYVLCSPHWVLCHRLELMNKGIRHGIII